MIRIGVAYVAATALSVVFCGAAVGEQSSPSAGAPPTMRLISTQQYAAAIADVFGADIENRSRFPALTRTDGLASLGAGSSEVTPSILDIFESSAHSIAAQVVHESRRDVLIPCKPRDATKPDETCARAFLGKAGRLLFRRSMSPADLAAYVAVANESAESASSFYAGIEAALAGMLVSPAFIHFIERTEPDPESPGQLRLDGPSKAIRLSLLMWNAPPDHELLRAAEAGELYSSQGLARQVDRMLASPRLQDGVRSFFEDMFVMSVFDGLAKDTIIYPVATLKVINESREQMLRIVVDHIAVRDRDYRDVFTTQDIFLTAALATVYRVPVSVPGSSLNWVAYQLPEDDPRAGLLTQLGFLSAYAHPGRSSATKRGKAIREIFMCQKVPDPPPNVDFSNFEDPTQPAHTARDRLALHNSNPVCAGCHKLTDPLGLALETFDGAGQFRTEDGGVPIDASGSLRGVKYSDAKGLAEAIRNDPVVTSCLITRLYSYALGRPAKDVEKETVAYLNKEFANQGFRVKGLLRTLATNEVFYDVTESAPAVAKVASN